MTTFFKNSAKQKNPPQDPAQLEAWCNKNGWLFVIWPIVLYLAIGVLVAIVTPDDIMRYPWAKTFVEAVALVAPSFMDVPSASRIPDVVRFYYAVKWFTLPIILGFMVWIYFAKCPAHLFTREDALKRAGSRARILILYILCFLFCLAAIENLLFSWYGANPMVGKVSRMRFDSRISLAIGNNVMTTAYLGIFYGAIITPRSIYLMWSRLPWFRSKPAKK